MKFYRSNKFDLSYYGQVNSLRLGSNVTHLWVTFILLAMVHRISANVLWHALNIPLIPFLFNRFWA